MLRNTPANIDLLKKSLFTLITELSEVLDCEYHVLVEDNDETEQKMKLIVHDKKILADEYTAYYTLFNGLPQDIQEELGIFAKENRVFFEEFSQKLKRNFTLIEARYKRSEIRVKSVFDAITSGTNHQHPYTAAAKTVTQLPKSMSQNITG